MHTRFSSSSRVAGGAAEAPATGNLEASLVHQTMGLLRGSLQESTAARLLLKMKGKIETLTRAQAIGLVLASLVAANVVLGPSSVDMLNALKAMKDVPPAVFFALIAILVMIGVIQYQRSKGKKIPLHFIKMRKIMKGWKQWTQSKHNARLERFLEKVGKDLDFAERIGSVDTSRLRPWIADPFTAWSDKSKANTMEKMVQEASPKQLRQMDERIGPINSWAWENTDLYDLVYKQEVD